MHVGCFCCRPKVVEDKPKPLRQRSCTDCLCLIVFLLFLVVLLFLLCYGVVTGDWLEYFYAADYAGHRCGDGQFKNRSKAFYPRIAQDLLDQSALLDTEPWKVKLYALCVASCPLQFNVTVPAFIFDYNYNPSSKITKALGSGTQQNWVSALPTVDFLNRCLPRTQASTGQHDYCAYPPCTSKLVSGLGVTCDVNTDWEICAKGVTASQCKSQKKVCSVKSTRLNGVVYSTYTSDAQTSNTLITIANRVGGVYALVGSLAHAFAYIMVGGIVVPVMASFCVMILLHFFVNLVVHLLVITLVLFLFGTVVLCYYKAGMTWGGLSPAGLLSKASVNISLIQDPVVLALASVSTGDQSIWTVSFWIMFILSILVFISLVLARKKIEVAVAIIREATTVFSSLPSLMIFPTWSVLFQAGVCVYGVIGAALLLTMKPESFDAGLSSVSVSNQTLLVGMERFRQTQSDTFTYFLLAIQVFGFLWLMQFVQAAAWTSMSGAVCYWYFFRHDDREKTRIPIMRSLYRVLRYHMGSIAFGSLIIAVFQFLRVLLIYLERQLNKGNNAFIKLVVKCCTLCLYCLEKTIRFITYYGFVFVALRGESFCSACFSTFHFIIENPVQVAINAIVIKLLTMVCIFTIPLGAAVSIYSILESKADVLNPVYPALAVALVAAFVTNACMNVFECVVTTLFVCCFRDVELYHGAYMSDSLRNVFGIPVVDPLLAKSDKMDAKELGTTDEGNAAAGKDKGDNKKKKEGYLQKV